MRVVVKLAGQARVFVRAPVHTPRPNFIRQFSAAKMAYQEKKLAVIGAGQMGLGIALVAASVAKLPVSLIDSSADSLARADSFLDSLLAKDVKKGRLTAAGADEVKGRIVQTTDFSLVSDADFIIEAVPEIPALKTDIFARLAAAASPTAVLATNTSSISITKIAAAAKGAEHRVVSTHFMNPVPVQKGVEVIVGLQTAPETLARALELVKRLGKVPSISKDSPGFLANRILIPYINEAVICLETGVGTKEDIDSIMKNGCAMPMGPLALADFIGLDTVLAIMNVLYNDMSDSKYRPAVLLQKMVDAGWLGKKSGKGFYEY
ncbi:3-hydroxyacyl-CoA dehydrogenase [Dipodascopsis tothii]|uniref:3-hydroxyacyl-CoA dehydrogenase n=1 Tax=Dipodascopsis tothii TaxID=44089 RepID=UPI0034CDD7FF